MQFIIIIIGALVTAISAQAPNCSKFSDAIPECGVSLLKNLQKNLQQYTLHSIPNYPKPHLMA